MSPAAGAGGYTYNPNAPTGGTWDLG